MTFRSKVLGTSSSPTIHLPTEILTRLLSFIPPNDFSLLTSCCLTSRLFYSASIAKLYERPLISGRNFDQFTATICPPLKARTRKHNLGDFVKHLDLSALVHESSPSTTARLLGRVKKSLVSFVAPAASFSENSLIPLFKCKNLEFLDVSLLRDEVLIKTGNFYPARRLPSLRYLAVRIGTGNYDLSPANPVPSLGYPSTLTHLQISGYPNDGPLNAILAGDDDSRHLWPDNITEVTLMDGLEAKFNVGGVFRNEVNMISLFISATPIALTLKKLFISEHIWSIHTLAVIDLADYTPNLISLSVSCSLQVNGLATGTKDVCLDQWPHLENLEVLGPSNLSHGASYEGEYQNLYGADKLNLAAQILPSLLRISYHCRTNIDVESCQRSAATPLLRQNARGLNERGREPPVNIEEEAGLFMVVKSKGKWQGSIGWDPEMPRYESELLVEMEAADTSSPEEWEETEPLTE